MLMKKKRFKSKNQKYKKIKEWKKQLRTILNNQNLGNVKKKTNMRHCHSFEPTLKLVSRNAYKNIKKNREWVITK